VTIAFIHVPKTGGLSFRESLLKHEIDFYYDNHKYMEQVFKINNNFEFVSFFRDPLEIAISGYYFMKRHKIVHDKHLYPIDYLLSQRIKNSIKLDDYIEEYPSNIIYQRFIGKEYLKYFKFIGNTNQYSKSITLFNKIFDLNLQETYVNENPKKIKNERYAAQVDSLSFISRNSIDYEIYSAGIYRFQELCLKYIG
jgi:hypothetical protein